MNSQSQASAAGRRKPVLDKLAEKPDGVLETIAAETGTSTRFVLECLPENERVFIDASRFSDVWQEVGEWGEVLFVVHNGNLVLECAGSLPPGNIGHGYFNFHGDSSLGGHLKADAVKDIAIVDRRFHGRRSCSIQFFGPDGEAIFKVFVRRNEAREMFPAQLQRFETLKGCYSKADA